MRADTPLMCVSVYLFLDCGSTDASFMANAPNLLNGLYIIMCIFSICDKKRKFLLLQLFFYGFFLYRIGIMFIFALAIVPKNLIQFIMSNLVLNPESKDYFRAKACVAISRRYNYAGSYRSYRFNYLCFYYWSSSYRAAFCYVLKRLEDAVSCRVDSLTVLDVYDLFVFDSSACYNMLCEYLKPCFLHYSSVFTPAEKLSFVYKLLEVLSKYNLGLIRYDLVSPMFEQKSAIRYAVSKYFPNTPFIEIESDFMFRDVMD